MKAYRLFFKPDRAVPQFERLRFEEVDAIPLGDVVRLVFRMRLEGKSLREIAGELRRRGAKTQRGGEWRRNTVHRMLRCPFYAGWSRHRDKYTRGEPHTSAQGRVAEANGAGSEGPERRDAPSASSAARPSSKGPWRSRQERGDGRSWGVA
ncbi:MAG: recombinase family protein [Planctomycetota bacterium]